MGNKLVLLGLGIMAVGLLALPQTMALFLGQHNFYDVIASDTNVPCKKCHGDVYAELNQPGQVNALHKGQGCDGCHMTTAPQKEGLRIGGDPANFEFHAAAAPACIDCHSGTGPGKDARTIHVGSAEVHKPFANQSNTTANILLKGANEACIGCHAHVAVDINWTKAYKISFSAKYTDGSTHDWIISDFNKEGNATFQTYGNMSGSTTGATKPEISITPTPPGYDPNNP